MSETEKKRWELKDIVEPLLIWYEKEQRILPWRKDRNPYRVWVSEIMLQQTRVEAVIPYFNRFMEKLPTINQLAIIDDDELMKLWEGLGYYSRVRNLKKAAQVICGQYGGEFPHAYKDILSLPGIGPYTAGAISSIAFEMPYAAVDGNVLRVYTRITENLTDINNMKFRNETARILEEIYPRSFCGKFTQALMELGAMVCVPNGFPKCENCPINEMCSAYQNGTQMKYPVKESKKERKKVDKTVVILRCDNKIAVRKRQEKGLLYGLWEFPNIEGIKNENEVIDWLKQNEIETIKISSGIQAKHIFTHIEWNMHSYHVQCKNKNENFTWVSKEYLKNEISLPTAFRKLYVKED